jgi:hypothetical protein
VPHDLLVKPPRRRDRAPKIAAVWHNWLSGLQSRVTPIEVVFRK